jgi:hypothetical protein
VRRILFWLLENPGDKAVPILELPVYCLCLVLLFAGVFLMHFRLRCKSSLILVISFPSLVASFLLTQAYREHLFTVSEQSSASRPVVLTTQDSAESTAEAFSKMPLNSCFDCSGFDTMSNFEVISTMVLLVLLLTSCAAFFFSAKSLAVYNRASKGAPNEH